MSENQGIKLIEIDGLYVDTRTLEQGTDYWRYARMGHVSASSISDLMAGGEGKTRAKYLNRIVAERLTGITEKSFVSSAMEWGVEHEPFARMAYEAITNTFVEKTGFWVHPKIQWFGASPDGLVGDDGLVEIKCPETTTHIKYVFDDEVPNEYYKQMQCQMCITGRQWCDFISFDPRLTSKKRLFIKRCERDEKLISKMEIEVKKFLSEVEVLVEKWKKE